MEQQTGKPNYKEATLRGAKRAPKIIWQFLLLILPCILCIQIFEKTGWISVIAGWFAPAMALFRLPGEAALVLIGAQFSLYSGIAAAMSLGLDAAQMTIAFVFTGCLHSTFIETALVKKSGASPVLILSCRLLAATLSALLVSLLV